MIESENNLHNEFGVEEIPVDDAFNRVSGLN